MGGTKADGGVKGHWRFGGNYLMSSKKQLSWLAADYYISKLAEDGGQRKPGERPAQKDTEEPRMSHMVSLTS